MLSRPGWIGSAGGAGAWPYVCKRLSFCGTPNLIPFSHSLYNVQQNLRRVRVPSPRSPVMTKPPVCLLTHPFSAPAVLHPDEPCSCFFFPLGILASILRVPFGNTSDRSRYRYYVHCWLSNALVACHSSLLALRTKRGLLLRLLSLFYRNLSWSVLFAFRVR